MDQSNNLQWILTPRKVFHKIAELQSIPCQPKAFNEIDSNHKKRAEWIEKKKKEDEIKQKEAIEQKLNLMDGQEIESQKSDQSD